MTPEEVICGWMEPLPGLPPYWGSWPEHQWWRLVQTSGGGMAWIPVTLDLDALHEVEARLTDGAWPNDQWRQYLSALFNGYIPDRMTSEDLRFVAHATAKQKIRALASVIRAGVSGGIPTVGN